jgi:hypothetical protein
MDKLREQIREVLCFVYGLQPEFENDTKKAIINQATDQILKLFKERMLELIGDNIEEYTPPTFTTSKKVLTEEYVKGYNQAKAELRKKVGE